MNFFNAGDEAVAPAAQQRMLEVCRQVITRAAQDTWQPAAGQHQHDSVSHHVTDGTSWEQVRQWHCQGTSATHGAGALLMLSDACMLTEFLLLIACIY